MDSCISFTNGTRIFLKFKDDNFLGIEKVTLDDETILTSGRGSLPYTVTPDGIIYQDFRFIDQQVTKDSATLEFEAIGRANPIEYRLDLFQYPVISRNVGTFSDKLKIFIKAANTKVAGENYRGFSISYEWSSKTRKINWLLDSVAFAPAGTIKGTRVMALNMTANLCPLEAVLDAKAEYSTEENYGSPCIQSCGRGSGSQFFDLAQGPSLAVVNYFATPSEHGNALMANCQTRPGEDFLTVSDFHYGKLSSKFSSSTRTIVAAPRNDSSREDAINRWTAWREYTGDLWLSKLNIKKTHSVPTLTFEGTGAGGIDLGVAPPDMLETWEKRLDWVVAQGFKAVNLHTPEWESAATRRTAVASGNNCCPFRFELSDHLGGEEGLKKFCDACHERGIKVYVWIAGHLHKESPIWKKHPDWVVRNRHHGIWDGHYGIIHSYSFQSGARDWVYNDLKHLRKVTGVDGVWLDSFAGLTYGTINHQSPDLSPNAPALLAFLGDLSELGYEIMIEGMSQLGVSSWGNITPEQITGSEELLIDVNFRYYNMRQWAGENGHKKLTRENYFRSLAARGPISVWLDEFYGHPEKFPLPLPVWFAPLTNAYNAVSGKMHTRILSKHGALWLDRQGKPAAFFAYKNSRPEEIAKKKLTNLLTGKKVSSVQKGVIYAVSA